MMTRQLLKLQDTLTAGHELAQSCPNECVIFLMGALGTGKTTLARGFLQGLKFQGIVKSPSYTLVEPYYCQGKTVFHFDLYRLKDPAELEMIGIRDYTLQAAIWLVEWPERGLYAEENQSNRLLPSPDISLHLFQKEPGRQLQGQAYSDQGARLLEQWKSLS